MTTGKKLLHFWNIVKPSHWLIYGASVCIMVSTIFAFLAPLVLKITVDSVIGHQKVASIPSKLVHSLVVEYTHHSFINSLLLSCALLILCTFFRGLFHFLSGYLSSRAAESTVWMLRDRLFDHIQKLRYEVLVGLETGDTMQRATSDVETVRKCISIQSVEIGRCICMIAIAFPLMLLLHVQLACIAIVSVPMLVIFSCVFFKKVQKLFLDVDECEGQLSNVLQENLTGVRVIKAYHNQQYEIDKFDKKNDDYRIKLFRLIHTLSFYWSITDLIAMAQIGLVLICSIFFATAGTLTVGTLLVFILYESMLLFPIRQMGRTLADIGKALVSMERIREILDKPTEIKDPTQQKPLIRGHITFNMVDFSYSNGTKVLHGITCDIKPGMFVAILGKTGCGKSTLVHLLNRLIEYTAGSITIDGIELKQIDRSWLRKHVKIVNQEPFLYAKTIKQNIMAGDSSATLDQIEHAAQIACLESEIAKFSEQYDTIVGEKGISLSGGQRQRVAIARACLDHCPVLIFDDSFSAVDIQTDVMIRAALKKKKKDRTMIVIAHRIATVSGADLIIVMDKGRIIQLGTHEELLEQEGLYKDIWHIQASLADELEQEEELQV